MENNLEYRMYFLTPYNLSPIQAGIQPLHGVVEYHLLYGANEEYLNWAKNWKTVIVLNGGTSNNQGRHFYENDINNPNKVIFTGTMESHRDLIASADINHSTFYEPDANNMLTSIAFLCDERVFKTRQKSPGDVYYPHFEEWLRDFKQMIIAKTGLDPKIEYRREYQEWVDFVGGPKNVFLRDFTSKFPLANN